MSDYRLLLSFLLSFFLLNIANIKAQVVTTTPAFPEDSKALTIFFNADQGSKGLKGYTGDVYAHIGVITNKSTSGSDWKYVKTNWGQNTSDTKLTRISGDKYKLEITPDVRTYFGVPSSEEIQKIALVFRSEAQVNGSWLEGKNADFSDIFVDIYKPGLNVYFETPSDASVILDQNDTLFIKAVASSSDTILLFKNGKLTKKTSSSILLDTIIENTSANYELVVEAKNNSKSVFDTLNYFVRSAPQVVALPAGLHDGINYENDSTVTLVLYAPNKGYAFLYNEFHNWKLGAQNYMYKTPDGNRFWIRLSGLKKGKEYAYQYFVDNEIKVADPYCDKVLDPWNDKYIDSLTYPGLKTYPSDYTTGIVSVFQTAQSKYQWKSTSYKRPAKTDLVVYELLIRDFTKEHNYQSLIDTLGYLKRLGVNAIELMPINEFEGNLSWGYNPSFYFAPDKYYGTKDKLKEFIDTCHANNIAVVLDMVLNHTFGSSPMVRLYWDEVNNRPASNNPWYNPVAKHDFNVGYDMNHESQATKTFVDSVTAYWIDEYHVDGYRFDLSKGFTQNNTLGNTAAWGQYDQSRIDIWDRISKNIWKYDPSAFIILEHFAENSEEKVLADKGMMPWGNLNHAYGEAAMGYVSGSNSDIGWASYKNRGWSQPNLVSYMESHDEERMMYRNLKYGNESGNYSVKDTATALKRAELAATFFLTIPGPKMLLQFEELGYDYTIDYNGRTGNKPVRWDYANDSRRKNLFQVISALAHLKTSEVAFESTNYDLDVSGAQKVIRIQHNDMSVVVLGNFDVVAANVYPNFPFPTRWYEFFTDDSINVSGTDLNKAINLQPGEYRLYTSKRIQSNVKILRVSETNLDLDWQSGSSNTFDITSNTNWSVSSNQSWCVVDKSSGKGKSTISIHANSDNLGMDARVATLTISGQGAGNQSIKVTQAPKPQLSASVSKINLNAEASSNAFFNITSNASWTITLDQNWLTASPSSDKGSKTVMIIATSANTSGAVRTAKLTISASGTPDVVIDVDQDFSVSVNDPMQSKPTVFPNPVKNKLLISFPEEMNVQEIALFDLRGKKILVQKNLHKSMAELDLTSLPEGSYVLKIIGDKTFHSLIYKE